MFRLFVLFLLGINVAFSAYELPEIPSECGRNECIKLLSITTDVSTNIGITRNGVKSGVWLKLVNSKPHQIIFHQPKNAPLHDVINVGVKPYFTPKKDRIVLKDDDTEAMLKFNSTCSPEDFAAASCTRFDVKLKVSETDWKALSFEIIDGVMHLRETTGLKEVTRLYLKAHADHLSIFGGDTKAHFTSIVFDSLFFKD